MEKDERISATTPGKVRTEYSDLTSPTIATERTESTPAAIVVSGATPGGAETKGELPAMAIPKPSVAKGDAVESPTEAAREVPIPARQNVGLTSFPFPATVTEYAPSQPSNLPMTCTLSESVHRSVESTNIGFGDRSELAGTLVTKPEAENESL